MVLPPNYHYKWLLGKITTVFPLNCRYTGDLKRKFASALSNSLFFSNPAPSLLFFFSTKRFAPSPYFFSRLHSFMPSLLLLHPAPSSLQVVSLRTALVVVATVVVKMFFTLKIYFYRIFRYFVKWFNGLKIMF